MGRNREGGLFLTQVKKCMQMVLRIPFCIVSVEKWVLITSKVDLHLHANHQS